LVAKNGALMNLRGSHDQRSYSGDVLKRPGAAALKFGERILRMKSIEARIIYLQPKPPEKPYG